MKERLEGLLLNLFIYLLAFGIGLIPFILIGDMIWSTFAFTMVATLVVFVFTCFIPDTSIYDPYWSVAPAVIWLNVVLKYRLINMNSLLIGIVILFWGFRLTLNWWHTYKGLCHEDWRYAQYRKKLNKIGFFAINLVGLQYVPTIVVFASLLPALVIMKNPSFNPLIIIGLLVSVAGVVLEIISDRAIHRFLKEKASSGSKERTSCNVGPWKYSRHPNYLGEITFWFGLFIAFLLTSIQYWYCGLGFIIMPLLFIFISIPMMEKHNKERRSDYEEYAKKTSMLLLLPNKK